MKSIITVNGPIKPEEVGFTSMHDHILTNAGFYRDQYALLMGDPPVNVFPPDKDKPVAMEDLACLSRGYFALSNDAWQLDDESLMADEVGDFKAAGGGAILECSAPGIRPNVAGLRRISGRTGVHIIASTGLYGEESWPERFKDMSVDGFARYMNREIEYGIDDTAIRAGHIKTAVHQVTDRQLEIPEVGFTLGDDIALLDTLVGEIETAGGKGLALSLDVTDTAQIAACVGKTCDVFGGVDILFNNAGVVVGVGPFLDIPDSGWDLSWQVNVKGMVDMCRAVIPRMQAVGGRSIINTSSMTGLRPMAGYAGYATTKFAVVGLSKAIAAEFGPENIRCNAICPGNILSDMGESEVNFIAMEQGISQEAAMKVYDDMAALARAGQPEEIGDLVTFLAGPNSSFITGAAIPIHGGMQTGI